jgi:hypothetical protein
LAWKKLSTWVLLRCSDFARKKQQVAKMQDARQSVVLAQGPRHGAAAADLVAEDVHLGADEDGRERGDADGEQEREGDDVAHRRRGTGLGGSSTIVPLAGCARSLSPVSAL